MTGTEGKRKDWGAKALVVALAVVSCAVGAIPALLPLVSLRWLAVYAALVALVAILLLRKLSRPVPNSPTAPEMALAGVAATGATASLSLVTIGTYWVGYGVWWVVVQLAHLIGWQSLPAPSQAARVVGLTFCVLSGVSAVQLVTNGLWRQLFPNTAGVPSPYARFMRQSPGRLALCALLAVAVALALFVFVGVDSRQFHVWLAIYLVLLGSSLWNVAEVESRPHVETPIERAVSKLLQASGFTVVAQPRTGNPEIDPLLLKADFFAVRGRRGMLIAIKVRTGDRAAVEWTEGSHLISAAWSLTVAREQLGLELDEIEPVLVLVGHGPGGSLQTFGESQPIRVLHIASPDELSAALVIDDPDRLVHLAHDIFAPLDAPGETSASTR